MGLFVLGVNHKECPVAIREKLHFSESLAESALLEMKEKPELSELTILSTCNRVEFFGYAEDVLAAKEEIVQLIGSVHDLRQDMFLPYLYHYEGKEAVSHLFRVACGLDSLAIGETEILGQFRDAFKLGNRVGSVHSLVYRLMEKVLKTGKDVRALTKITQGAVSIPAVAVELAEKIFGHLRGQKVMMIGTGEMSSLTLKNLRQAGGEVLYVVSRNEEKGTGLAKEYDAKWLPMDQWVPYLESVDILMTSTSAPHFLVHFDQIKQTMGARKHRPLFLIDIAVPRNIDPQINELDDVYLYNVDDLKGVAASNLRLRRGEIQQAEEIIEDAVAKFQAWIEQLSARPTMERFEKFLNEVLDKELEAMGSKTGLSSEAKDAIRERLRAKLLHRPLEKIKEASQNGGVSKHLEALNALFDLDKNND